MTAAGDFTEKAIGCRVSVTFENVKIEGRVRHVGRIFRRVLLMLDGTPLPELWLPNDFPVTVESADLRFWALTEPDADVRHRLIEEYVDRCLPELHEVNA